VQQLSLGVSGHFESERNHSKLMQRIARRVAAGMAAAVRDKLAKKAEELCASGQFAAAMEPLDSAIVLGNLSSKALMAWILLDGREGLPKNREKAFRMVYDGTHMGCPHCQGVLALCYTNGYGCVVDDAQSLELARESSGKNSRYGQYTLGVLHMGGKGGYVPERYSSFTWHGYC
jgi:TPR repeat protein